MVTSEPTPHVSVLYHEILKALKPWSAGKYVDGTLGAGGHSIGILRQSSPYGEVLGLDVDQNAISIAEERLSIFANRIHLRHGSYTEMADFAEELGWASVDGIVLDLGASSMQFDTSERGFSFLDTGPLDMRFDPTEEFSAADLVNTWSEEDLADVIYRFGEERKSRKIARMICKHRPLHSTKELAALIEKAVPRKHGRIHPATRTFQALRIAVNEELQNITEVLPTAIDLLAKNGILAVISFHSLEDRLVKTAFNLAAKDCICPPELPICNCQKESEIKILTKKPITASDQEITENPRARSAKLRIAQKL